MDKNELLIPLKQELRRGVIVLAVLSQLETAEYGYSLVTQLSDGGVDVEANTLYPLLRRLEGQGLLESSWDTSEGKPRKYYLRTKLGLDVYNDLAAAWRETNSSLETLLQKSIKPEENHR